MIPWLLAPILLVSFQAFPRLAAAEGGGRGEGPLQRVCEHIECSEDQEVAIRDVFVQARVDSKDDHEAIRELRRQIADEWVKDTLDEAKLDKLHARVASHERNIAERRHEAMLELHDLLTAEQREQVVELLAEQAGKRGKKGKTGKKAKKSETAE
jgi:Spy/CpxP family protein refolding chaperone